jgi:hypothetical protein
MTKFGPCLLLKNEVPGLPARVSPILEGRKNVGIINSEIITSGPGVNSMTHTLKNAQSLNLERKAAPGHNVFKIRDNLH